MPDPAAAPDIAPPINLTASTGFFTGVASAIIHGAASVYHEILTIEDDVTKWTANNPALIPLMTYALDLANSYASRLGIPTYAISLILEDILAALKLMAANDPTVGSGMMNAGVNTMPPLPANEAALEAKAAAQPTSTVAGAVKAAGSALSASVLAIGLALGLTACEPGPATTSTSTSTTTTTPPASTPAQLALTAIEAGYTLLANDAAACITSGACSGTVAADIQQANTAAGAAIDTFKTQVNAGATVDTAALATLPTIVGSITKDLTAAGKLSPLADVATTTGLQMLSLYLNPSVPVTVTLPASS